MPEKPNDEQAPEQMFGVVKRRNCIMNSNNLGNQNSSTQYTRTFEDDKDSEAFGRMCNLLETKINDGASMLLEREERPPYNPALVMDLRYEMVS
jgi:hypothetical protein